MLKSSEPENVSSRVLLSLLSFPNSPWYLDTAALTDSFSQSHTRTHTHTHYSDGTHAKCSNPYNRGKIYVLLIIKRKRRMWLYKSKAETEREGMKHRCVESLKYWDCDSLNSVSVMRA